MGSNGFLGVFLVIIPMLILNSSYQATAYNFIVGGKEGWVVKPSEAYNHWAERNRFQVNDTLHFKYNKGSDSVAVVNKENYDSCNPKNPLHVMNDGDSTFKFDKSGPFFFISGNVENCKHGQKLIVVVMAVRQKQSQSRPPAAHPSPAEAKSPAVPEPSVAPSIHADSPAPSPAHSGSMRFSGSVGVALGFTIGVALLFNTFA